MSFVTQRLFAHAAETPDKTAVAAGESSLSYRELASLAYGVSRALESMGYAPGDVIAPEAAPEPGFAAACYGIHLLGAVHVPVEYRIPDERLAEIAGRVSAKLLISSRDPGCGAAHITLADLLSKAADYAGTWTPETPLAFPPEEERGEILFTTGSTGRSKGVVQSRRAITAYLETINASLGMHPGTVMLVVTPLNHAGGLHRLHMTIHCGGTLVLMDGLKDLRRFYQTIRERGVNTLYLPPAGVHILLTFSAAELGKLDGQLDFVFTASAPFPEADRERMRRLLPTTRLIEAYGGSEVGSVCNCDYNRKDYRKGCLGRPYDCVKIRTVGEEGLIQIQSPMLMMGYLDDPALTESVFDGAWFRTSDRGRIDEDGNLYFLGRSDDVINVGGKKVAPSELEDVALRCEDVLDCACTSMEDPVAGTVLRLLVCIRPGHEFSPRKILRELRPYVEDYKLPGRIEQVASIPRLFNGKIDRKKLRSAR